MLDFLATNLIARAAFLTLIFVLVMLVVLFGSRAAARRADVKTEIKAIVLRTARCSSLRSAATINASLASAKRLPRSPVGRSPASDKT